MKIQTMQVERMEASWTPRRCRGAGQHIRRCGELNGLDLADRLVSVKNKHKRGMAHLESSGNPVGQTIAGMVTAAKQMARLPVLDDDLLGDRSRSRPRKSDRRHGSRGRQGKADDKQVLGYVKTSC